MGCVVNVVHRHLSPRYDLFVSYRSLESWVPGNSIDILLVLNQIPFYLVWPDFRGLPYLFGVFRLSFPGFRGLHFRRVFFLWFSPRLQLSQPDFRGLPYISPQRHLVVTRPVPTPDFEWPLLPYFFPIPQLVSLTQFPRAGTYGVFDTRYMLGSRLTYRPRLGPRRAELWCFLKNVSFLKSNLCVCIQFSFCIQVYFLYILYSQNAGKLSPGIAPPPFPLVPVGWGEVDFPLIHLTRPHSIHHMHWTTRRRGLGGGGGDSGKSQYRVPSHPLIGVSPFLHLFFSCIQLYFTVRFQFGFFFPEAFFSFPFLTGFFFSYYPWHFFIFLITKTSKMRI